MQGKMKAPLSMFERLLQHGGEYNAYALFEMF